MIFNIPACASPFIWLTNNECVDALLSDEHTSNSDSITTKDNNPYLSIHWQLHGHFPCGAFGIIGPFTKTVENTNSPAFLLPATKCYKKWAEAEGKNSFKGVIPTSMVIPKLYTITITYIKWQITYKSVPSCSNTFPKATTTGSSIRFWNPSPPFFTILCSYYLSP